MQALSTHCLRKTRKTKIMKSGDIEGGFRYLSGISAVSPCETIKRTAYLGLNLSRFRHSRGVQFHNFTACYVPSEILSLANQLPIDQMLLRRLPLTGIPMYLLLPHFEFM